MVNVPKRGVAGQDATPGVLPSERTNPSKTSDVCQERRGGKRLVRPAAIVEGLNGMHNGNITIPCAARRAKVFHPAESGSGGARSLGFPARRAGSATSTL